MDARDEPREYGSNLMPASSGVEPTAAYVQVSVDRSVIGVVYHLIKQGKIECPRGERHLVKKSNNENDDCQTADQIVSRHL